MPTKRRSGVSDRRNRDPEISAAAIRVFYEKGYSAASLQDVADIVGVLKGSLYHYISSKEELLFRILEQSHVQAAEIMELSMESSPDPLEQLRTYLTRMATWYLHNIERVSIYFNEGRWLTGERLSTVRQQRRDFETFLRSLIERARMQERLRPDVDARLGAQLILGALNSVSTWYRPDGLYSAGEIAVLFRDMMLAALAGEVPPARPDAPSSTRSGAMPAAGS